MLFGIVKAQKQNNIKFGIGAGMTLSTVFYENEDFFEDNRKGFSISGFAQMPLCDKISVQSGLSFVQKGEDHSLTILSGGIDLFGTAFISKMNDPRRISYLEVPLQIFFNFNESMSLYTGVSPAFLLKATRNISFENLDPEEYNIKLEEGVDNITDWYNTFDLGVNIGFNFMVIDHVFIDISFINGLRSIHKKSTNSNGRYNQVFMFMLGYQL